MTVDGLAAERAGGTRMPALAELIGRGARTTQAFSPSPGSFPATAAVLGGRVADPESAAARRAVERPGLAAALAGRGYRGLALPADPFAHARTTLASGFARFAPHSPSLADSARVDSAIAWLAGRGRSFVWLGLSFGEAPQAWQREDGPAYPDEAARDRRAHEIDAAIARLIAGLERAGLARSTLLAIAGTHGLRGDTEPLSVPVAFVRPGLSAPRTISGDAHLIDVAPTLIAAAGGTPAGFAGRALLTGAARPRRLPPSLPAASASPCRAGLDSLIGDGTGRPDSVGFERLKTLAERCPDDARVAVEAADALSRAGREADAARVYMALRERWPGNHAAALAYGQHLLRHRRFAMVANALAAIPRPSPFAGEAAWLEVGALAGELRFAEAAHAARAAAALVVPAADHAGIPATLDRLRDAQRALEDRTGDAAAHLEYGKLLGGYGLMEEAYKHLHRARFADTTRGDPDYWMATFLLRDGRLKPAQATLERALRTEPGHHRGRALLAEVLVRLDRWKEAVPHLERVVAEHPGDAQSRYNLACLLARSGRSREALEALKLSVEAGYTNFEGMRTDPDLAALRDLPEFRALLPPGR